MWKWFHRFLLAFAATVLGNGRSEASDVPGNLQVNQAVSPAGSVNSRIAVPVIPGAGSLEPSLALQYSGGGENIGIGTGWSLSGYPVITRGARNWETDGTVAGVGLDENDAFYLDGARLVPVSRVPCGGQNCVEFRKELDDGSVVRAELAADGNPRRFVLETRAGLTTTFGQGPVISRSGSSVAIAFLPERTSDRSGNYIQWEFEIRGLDYDLVRVKYTGQDSSAAARAPFAEIALNYEAAPRARTAYLLGQPLVRTRRLRSIVSRTTAPELTPQQGSGLTLDLDYQDTASGDRFFLSSVRFTGYDGNSWPATSLTYRMPVEAWTRTPSLELPVDLSGSAGHLAYQFARVRDSGGAPALGLMVGFDGQGGRVSRAYALGAGGWIEVQEQAPPVAFVDLAGRSTGVLLVDINGDGLTDVLQSDPRSGTDRAFLRTNSGWNEQRSLAPGVPLVDANGNARESRQLDLDGDRKLDLLVATEAGMVVLLNRGTHWELSAVHGLDLTTFRNSVLGDVDCDGATDLVALEAVAGQIQLRIRSTSSAGWGAATTLWSAPTQSEGGAVQLRRIRVVAENCAGLLVGRRDGAAERFAILVHDAAGWRSVEARFDAQIFATANGEALAPRFADVTGDGADDVLVNQIVEDTAHAFTLVQQPRASPTDAAVWRRAAPELSTPVVLANAAGPDPTISAMDVNGDGREDLAATPGAGRPGGSIFLSNGQTWQRALEFSPSTSFSQENATRGWIRFADLNGDGLTDFLFHRGGTAAGDKGAYLNTGRGWQAAPEWAPPRQLQAIGDVDAPGLVLDVNADGLPDLVYAFADSGGATILETYLNRARDGVAGWGAPVPEWRLPAILARARGGDLGGRFADLDADGRIDLIFSFQSRTGDIAARIFRNTGSGWEERPNATMPGAFAMEQEPGQTRHVNTHAELIDMDGDRLPDLVASYLAPGNLGMPRPTISGIFRNLGGRFAQTASQQPPVPLDEAERGGPSVSFYDLNADGFQDLVQASRSSARVYLGTGEGFTRAAAWDLPGDAASDAFGFGAVRIIDVTGDGFPDLLYHAPQRDGTLRKGIFLNNGVGWQRGSDGLAPPEPFLSETGTDAGVRSIDVNGDNALDLVRSMGPAGGSATQKSVYLSANSRSGMLAEVSSGSIVTAYRYAVLTEPAAAAGAGPIFTPARQSSWPAIAIAPMRPVVVSVEVDEGGGRRRGTQYAYGEFRYDLRNAISLGFGWTQRSETPSRIRYRTDYNQSYALLGLASADSVFAPADAGGEVAIVTTRKQWRAVSVPGLTAGGRQYRFLQVMIDAEQSEGRDLTGAVTSRYARSFAYDEWLNTTRLASELMDGSANVIDNEFGSGDERRFGRLRRSTSMFTRPGVPGETRIASFTYDPVTLLLSTETALEGQAAYSTTVTYERNGRGSISSTTTSAAGLPDRIETVGFDDLDRMATATANALQHRSRRTAAPRTIAAALGLPSTIADPNGLTASVDYDGFGRITRKVGADGVELSYERLLPAAIPAEWLAFWDHANAVRPARCRGAALTRDWLAPRVGSAEVVWVTPRNGVRRRETIRIYDGAGRLVRQISPRTDGSRARLAFTDSEFDILGRLIGQSRPYFANERSHWLEYSYDALDRRIREHRSDGTCFTFEYRGDQQSRVDPLGHRASATVNARGQPVRVTHADGGVTRFDYDVMDRVTLLTSPMGAVTRFRYDPAGNRSWTQDPDAGVTEFAYDAYGRLRTQQAAGEPEATEFSYDLLGRPTRIWRPDRVINWTYDPDHGVGAVATMRSTTQNVQNTRSIEHMFDYDALGRLHRRTVTLSGPSGQPIHVSSHSVAYDEEGRVRQLVYPGANSGPAYAVERVYDPETGQLRRLNDNRSTQPVWQSIEVDALGRTLRLRYGNGVEERRVRADDSGALRSQRVVRGGSTLSNARFDYDDVGNLLARREAATNTSETFTYDATDRLESMTSGGTVRTAQYDLAGRFVRRSEVGRYVYGCEGAPANGVCRIDAAGGQSSAINYDGRGNVRQTAAYSVDLTSDNLVRRLAVRIAGGQPTNFYSEFEYDAQGARAFTTERGCEAGCFVYRTKETLHMGLSDRIKISRGTSILVTMRHYVEAGDGAFLTVDVIDRTAATGPDRNGPAEQRAYLHRDHLGSIVMATGHSGNVLGRFSYDPWGRASGLRPESDNWAGGAAAWTRGFSGHDHVPQFPVIHMNGRVYDAELAVFLSVDPLIGDPGRPTALNPYAYALNNPLAHRDITGFGLFEDFRDAVSSAGRALGRAAGDFWDGTRNFVERNWREIVTVAVVVAVTAATSGAGTGPVVAAMAGGAAGGATSAALHGGSASDILAGTIVGGVFGAFGGAIGASAPGVTAFKVFGFGTLGGLRAQMAGGDFGRGFAVGALMAGGDAQNYIKGESYLSTAGRIGVSAAVNGTIAELSGDKFANGAISGAFYQLSRDARRFEWTRVETVSRYVSMYQAREATLVGLGAGALLYGIAPLYSESVTVSFDNGAFIFEGGGSPGAGVTFGNTIFYTAANDNGPALRKHELVHLPQWGAYGSNGYMRTYRQQVDLFGYCNAPFEAEAYNAGGSKCN